ncbi:Uncharacterised protein [Mycobacterium tuberculosis]|nr:Uncharacterised protein [Mycobacterium tuberculosis]
MGRVNHREVRTVTLAQRARAYTEPLGQLTGEAIHCPLDGQKRLSGPVGVSGSFEQPKPEVVERHIAQVRAGVGEAHVDTRFGGQLVQLVGPVIGDDGGPSDIALPVVHQHIEERVQRVQPALVGYCPETLTDQRLIRAFDDHGVVEVPMPQRRSELDAIELAPERPAVRPVGQELVALQLVTQMKGRRSGAELLEDRQVDAVGVQLERDRQMLESHLRA